MGERGQIKIRFSLNVYLVPGDCSCRETQFPQQISSTRYEYLWVDSCLSVPSPYALFVKFIGIPMKGHLIVARSAMFVCVWKLTTNDS